MKIEKNKVVSIEYTLKDKDGNVLDSSKASGQPLLYLHGRNNLIPGLEKELEGKSAGDKINAVIAPADAYGEVNPQLIAQVPRSQFDTNQEVKAGMAFYAESEAGPVMVRVTKVEGDTVTIDANHELAGQTLYFDVEVVEVTDAEPEQIEAGSVYIGGGCGGCGGGCGGNCGGGGNCDGECDCGGNGCGSEGGCGNCK